MNLKSNYENEVIHMYITFFMTILSIIVLICDWIAIKQLIEEEVSISLLIIVVFLFLGIPSLFLFFTYKSIYDAKVNRKKAKDIMENGIKVQGKIIDIRTERVDRAMPTELPEYRYYYHLIVEYSNKIENFKVETPRVNFHPDYLTSKDVDVYLYQHDFYVDNFKLDLDKIEKNKRNAIRTNLIVILFFVLLCIVNAIIIFLSITNVIPSEMGIRLCMISLVISAVAVTGIYIVKGIINMIKVIKEVYKN